MTMEVVHCTINCRGRLLTLDEPRVMGILNVTPDSFYDGGFYQEEGEMLTQVERMLDEGASIIDIGGMSTRPGSAGISEEEELRRVMPVVEGVVRRFPEAILSIDTVHSRVARETINAGAHLINDVSAGRMDQAMYQIVAELEAPYVLMHMQGTPATMQQQPSYQEVSLEILDFFIVEVGRLRDLGVKDIILDPGFGFGKSLQHNYELLNKMHIFKILDLPVLAGISRKGMIHRLLQITPQEALNGTTALHMVCLQQGASILRAHDVKEAVEVIRLWRQLEEHKTKNR